MTRPSPRVMAAHASSYCHKHGWRRGGKPPFNPVIMAALGKIVLQGWAEASTGRLHYPPVISTKSYLVAMHEIGHMMHEHTNAYDSPAWHMLAIEAEATGWARDHMLEGAWDTPVQRFARHQLQRGLDTCLDFVAKLGMPLDAFLPPAEHRFWSLLGTTRAVLLTEHEAEDNGTELTLGDFEDIAMILLQHQHEHPEIEPEQTAYESWLVFENHKLEDMSYKI